MAATFRVVLFAAPRMDELMCCFAQPVNSVRNTRIFARPTGQGTQFLVYQMNYESAEENAMILPIPVKRPASEQSVRFVDLKEYPHFFYYLDQGFPKIPSSFQFGCAAEQMVTSASQLDVHEVGNYVASFVPTIADFERLDPRFTLSQETWSHLPQYQDYSFAVFQLASGHLKPHPMAFEFESAVESIFFPTVHIHDGQVHPQEEFDHVLYTQHAGLDSQVHGYQNANVPDSATGLVRSKFTAKSFCETEKTKGIVAPELLVHRREIRGSQANRDVLLEAKGDPLKATLNLRYLRAYTPWFVIGGVIAWFMARRSRLMGRRGDSPA